MGDNLPYKVFVRITFMRMLASSKSLINAGSYLYSFAQYLPSVCLMSPRTGSVAVSQMFTAFTVFQRRLGSEVGWV